MNSKSTVIIILLVLIAVIACRKGSNDAPQPDDVRFVAPSNFPQPVYSFENNAVTKNGFELGRKLFFDSGLSIDGSVSCGSCHQPFAAFANLDHSVSHGVDNCLGTRNTPPLFNLVWQQEFMWDGGVRNIEVSPLNALTNPCEMANTLTNVVDVLNKSNQYPALFNKAFGTSTVTSQLMFRALTQFMSMLVSANSKYDKHIRKETGGDFSIDEEAGYQLFIQKCSVCHKEPLFTDLSYRSNGLDLYSEDRGRDSITQNEADRGKFRVPTLRNIEVTMPYMHDGRFNTLKRVLEHYNSGVKNNPNLDAELKKNGVSGIPLTQTEQTQIIAFLKTLTDNDFIHDKRFAEQ
ncbi:cytochrome c peroxidase [Mucilaginibacter gynuensis]|uniref:Cytochrome c peroxidase n=1 Tax=Mucilaginibacter gynuensis TaxID=1302236 RepID=A0ABP8FN88_9SPHI